MPLFPTANRKTPEQRTPISHEVESHNRPYDAKKLEQPKVARTQRPREEVYAADYAKAVKDLEQPAGIAVQVMERLPMQLLECYLIAEARGQNRPDVLRRFPKPGASALKRYPEKKRAPRKVVPPTSTD